MTEPTDMTRLLTMKVVWLLVGIGLLVVAGANVHLLHVALTSQPQCIAHVRPGEGAPERGLFSAAQSSCAPDAPAQATGQAERGSS
jgi:hypothetical protein